MKKLKQLWQAYSARLQNVPDKKTYRKDCKIVATVTATGALIFVFLGGWWIIGTAICGVMALDCIGGIIATKEKKEKKDEVRKEN